MIFLKGINWNDFPASIKRGRFIIKDSIVETPLAFTEDNFKEFLYE